MEHHLANLVRTIANIDPHDTWIAGVTCGNLIGIIRADYNIQGLGAARQALSAEEYYILHRTPAKIPTQGEIAFYTRARELHQIGCPGSRALFPINVADLLLIQEDTWTSLGRWLNTATQDPAHGIH